MRLYTPKHARNTLIGARVPRGGAVMDVDGTTSGSIGAAVAGSQRTDREVTWRACITGVQLFAMTMPRRSRMGREAGQSCRIA